jgi:hypothetical protein
LRQLAQPISPGHVTSNLRRERKPANRHPTTGASTVRRAEPSERRSTHSQGFAAWAKTRRVGRVDASLIYCTPKKMSLKAAVRRNLIWTFDRETGAEVDDGLRWGPAYGISGSFLIPNDHPKARR